MQFPGRAFVHALVIVPFVLPTIVVATAFRSLGVERSLGAILLAHCFFNLAVVVRVVGTTWETLDRRTTDAARTLGAGPVRTFWSVTLPALRPALVAAGSIVFLFCFTSFGVILVLGGPTFATLETEIYRQTAELLDLRTAAVLSILQLARGRRRARASPASWPVAPVAGASVARDRVRLRTHRRPPARRARGRCPGSRSSSSRSSSSSGDRSPTAHVGWSRLDQVTTGFSASPLHAITTSLDDRASPRRSIAVTLGLALATAVTRRRRSRLGRVGELAVVLPLGVSAVTVGFGFLIVFDTPPLDLRTSWWIVPIAHALIALPFVVRTAVPLLRAIDPHQREAAALLGASPRRVWREVDLRVIARAAAVAAGFAFAISLGEFGATLFIVRPETTTVPIAIYRFLGRPGATNSAPGVRAGHDPDGRSPRSSRSPATASTPAPGGTDARRSTAIGVRYGTDRRGRRREPRGARRRDRRRARTERQRQDQPAPRGGRARAGDRRVGSGGTARTSPTVAPHRRGFGLMFQDHALFDHHDVAGNVAFGLRMQGVDRADARRTGRGDARPRRPRRDRAPGASTSSRAVSSNASRSARALAPAPRLLMLDEPLASVDRERREALARALHDAIRRTRTATLLVTHDLDEAFTLADSVVILDHGVVRQTGPATDVWRAPGDPRGGAVPRRHDRAGRARRARHDRHALGTARRPGRRARPGRWSSGCGPTDLVVDPAGPLAGHGARHVVPARPLPRGARHRRTGP